MAIEAWRLIADTTLRAWMQTLAGTPIARENLELTYEAARPHTKLCLAQLVRESNFGRAGIATGGSHNPLGLRPRGGKPGFQRFATWGDAILEWKQRITDPAYDYASTGTLSEYVHIYAPASDGNNEAAYVAFVEAYVETLPMAGGAPPVALKIVQDIAPALNENRPGIIVNADGTTRAGKLLRAPFRVNWHETANPARSATAKMHCDFVDNGGGDEGVSYHFAVDHLEARQILPLDEQGIHIGTAEGNATCLGIETCVNFPANSPQWAKAKDNLVLLSIAILDGDSRIDYGRRKPSDFPVDGFTIHGDWTGTGCPARIRAEGSRATLLNRVKAGLGSPPPPPPAVDFPPGMDLDLARRWFGTVVAHGTTYAFNPDGPLSQWWVEHGRETGRWPALSAVERFDARSYFRLTDGTIVWRPNDNASIRVLKG